MLTLEEGARRAVSCAGIRADERVLVLYDDLANAAPAWALRRAATERGANAHVRLLGRADTTGRPEGFEDLIDELLGLDVVFAFTRSYALGGAAAQAVVEHGGRVFTMTGACERTLTHGCIEADFASIAPVSEFLAARLTEATDAEVTTARGTRLTMSLQGRAGVPNPPAHPRAGVFRFPYAGAIVTPVETSVHGTVVVDVSTSGGRVDAPLTIVVEAGRAVAVSGKTAATEAEQLLAAGDDSAPNLLGVLGFGLNPAARLNGKADEHVALAGTGHFSLCPDPAIGEAFHSGRCLELVYAKPTLVLNGVPVLQDGTPESSPVVR